MITKLKVVDNWMYLTFFVDGKQLDEKKNGDVLIAWPDGTTLWHPFESKTETVTVHDMGHSNQCNRYRLLVQAELYGYDLEIPLEKLTVLEAAQ